MSPERRDDAPGGQRHGVLVDWLAVMFLDARGAQRQRAAERPAQVVSLRQLARVEGQQRARARQECHIEAVGARHGVNIRSRSPEAHGRGSAMRPDQPFGEFVHRG